MESEALFIPKTIPCLICNGTGKIYYANMGEQICYRCGGRKEIVELVEARRELSEV